MTHHVNHVVLVGKVIQTWIYNGNRIARLQMKRSAFLPHRPDGHSDLVNVVLPDALVKGQIVENGQELHVRGFVRSEDRDVSISSVIKEEIPAAIKDLKIQQIVTEVFATDWQIAR